MNKPNDAGTLSGKRIVIVCGEDEYRSERTLAELGAELGSRHGASVTTLACSPDPSAADHLPGLEALEEADLALFYLRFRALPEAQFRHIRRYLEAGKPVVGFRTSTHAFRYPDDHPLAEWNRKFGVDVLGAPWISHFGHSSMTDVSAVGNLAEHPVLRGVPLRFAARSWLYNVHPYPQDAEVLMNGYAVQPERWAFEEHTPRIHPVVWTRTHFGGGRVLATTLGHPEDFELTPLRRLVTNGIHWLLGADAPASTSR